MATPSNTEREIEAIFSYQDAQGKEAFQVVRFKPKDFRVRHRAANRHYVWKAPECNYPYHLPEILSSEGKPYVFAVEGEKDVETLRKLGFVATCNRGGCGNTKSWAAWGCYFVGRTVVVIPDNDTAGMHHAEQVAEYLAPHAAEVVLLELPGLDDKEDVSDWLRKKGNDADKLNDLVVKKLADAVEARMRAANQRAQTFERGEAWEPPAAAAAEEADEEHGWHPFPLDALPEIIAKYAEAGSKALPCDPTLIALPALVSCAGVIGNTRCIQLKTSWIEPSILWAVAVAGTGSKKSPAYNLGKQPLVELDYELAKENERRAKVAKQELWEWEERHGKRAGTAGDPADDPRPELPVPRRLLIGDITVETCIRELSKNPRGLTLIRDELKGWFGSFGKYTSTGASGSDLAFYLEAYQGGGYRYDRKSGDGTPVIVPRCSISVFGTIQPEVLQKTFTKEFFESGFAYRMLLAMPPKRRSRWTDDVIPLETRMDYEALLRALYREDAQEVNEDGWQPRPMTFDESGYKAWVHHHDEIEAMIDDAQGNTENLLEKLKATMARLALVFAQIDAVTKPSVPNLVLKDHVQRAARLVKWFFHEIQRVYCMIHASPEQFELGRVVEWIRSKGGEVTARDLFKSNRSAYGSTERAKLVLEQLAFKKVGTFEQRPTGAKGGRPTFSFRLS